VHVQQQRPPRYPWWQLVLLGLAGLAEAIVWPLRRMWRSKEPLDGYGLVHFTSAAGDALIALALADSVFFSIPVDEAELKVAAYLLLTMLPLAIAGPLLVVPLDRAGPRRAISLIAAATRAGVAVYMAPRVGTKVLFASALIILIASKVHIITKNGLTAAYADPDEGLMRANARLGRVAVGGVMVAAPFGLLALKLFGAAGPIYLAAAVYAACALLTLRLPHPHVKVERPAEVGRRGRIPELAGAAVGAIGMRAGSGFLLFLLAFALRRGGEPTWWFGVVAAGGVIGALMADVLAPRLPESLREEAVVVGCILVAGLGAVIAFEVFGLITLCVFGLAAGASAEFARLAFQSLMQQHAPEGALGRVFVRYEVAFQVAWVAGACLPALLPIDTRTGLLMLTGFYAALGVLYLVRPMIDRQRRGT
jgi:hypothetical protein